MKTKEEVDAATPPYGLKDWVKDGIASGFLFINLGWKAVCAGRCAVKLHYKTFPNQKRVEEIDFEEVWKDDLHAVRMLIIEADRWCKVRNLRIEEEMAKIPETPV